MNILIIGLGSIAKKHIIAIHNNVIEARIFALRHSHDSPGVDGIIDVYDLSEIREKIDFALISNPTGEHFNTIKNVLKLSCPLFIEKPLFASLKGATQLIEKIVWMKLKTYVTCVLRFHPVIHFLKTYLNDKRHWLNEINVYCGSYLPDWRPGLNFREIYSARRELGGGVHLDLIHEIDYTYYLFGNPNKASKVFCSKSSLEINSIDSANYCFEYDTFNVNIILNYFRVDPKRSIELLFDDQTLVCDLLASTVTNHQNEMVFSSETTMQDLYDKQLKYFCNTENPMNNIQEAMEVLKLAL